MAPGGRSAGPLPGQNAPGGRSAGPLPGPAVCREMKWPWLLCSEKGLRRAFIICSFASLGERLLLQEAGRSLSQNFVCAHVRLGRCYCRRPDGALTGGLKRRQLRPHWKQATQDISMSSRWSRGLKVLRLLCSFFRRGRTEDIIWARSTWHDQRSLARRTHGLRWRRWQDTHILRRWFWSLWAGRRVVTSMRPRLLACFPLDRPPRLAWSRSN